VDHIKKDIIVRRGDVRGRSSSAEAEAEQEEEEASGV